MMDNVKPHICKAILRNGDIVEYDGCGVDLEFYSQDTWTFLGIGKIYSVNGTLQRQDLQKEQLFFIKNWRVLS